MPPSLRKACHACIIAKRRCQPQLPQCSRCFKAGIACTYDLEPLTHVSSSSNPPLESSSSRDDLPIPPSLLSQPSYSVFDTVASAHQAAIKSHQLQNQGVATPELRMVAEEDILNWSVSQLKQIPEAILQNCTSPFVHAQLYSNGADSTSRMDLILELHETASAGAYGEVIRPSQNIHLQNLANVNIKGLPLNDVLIYIHELALYVIIYTCNQLPSYYSSEAQQYLPLLMEWSEQLWTANRELSGEGSQWHAWIVAESARRSMIACYMIKAAISVLTSGYCVYLPFLESLPFDPRIGLWEVKSEDAWQSAVMRYNGEPELLMSFREFIESYKDLSCIKQEGMFSRILLVSYYRKKAMQFLE